MSVIVVGIFLLLASLVLVLGFIAYRYYQNTRQDKIIQVNETATSNIPNNVIKYSINVKSNATNTSQEGYNKVTPVITKIQDMLDTSDYVENVKVSRYTDQSYQDNKQNGYISGANIQYDVNLDENQQSAINLQNEIMDIDTDNNVNILLQNVSYSIDDKTRNKFSNQTIVDAIEKAKIKAQQIITSTYGPGTKYQIVDTTTDIYDESSPMLYRTMNMNDSNSVESSGKLNQTINPGTTILRATVNMKIAVN